MSAPRYWRVVFTSTGSVASVTELDGPAEAHWVIVEAADEAAAQPARPVLGLRRAEQVLRQGHASPRVRGHCARARTRAEGPR